MSTVQRLCTAAVLAFLLFGRPAGASSIPIFGTGFGEDGALLAGGAVDPHYTLTSNAAGPGTRTYVTVADGDPIPSSWFADGPHSQWIEPSSGTRDNHPAGTYVYQTTFDLTGLDPATATITFRGAVDNAVTDVLLNGASTGISFHGFTSFSEIFTIDSGFVSGVNTLTFEASNGTVGSPNNPTGLRIAIISATATAVPEPSNWVLALFGGGFVVARAWRYRRGVKPSAMRRGPLLAE